MYAEKAMAPHSSTLAWKIPWMEEPGGLQSMGSQRVGHDWATSLSLSCIGERNGNPRQCSCLESPRDGRAWWVAIYGVAQSQTRLKWLSSSIHTQMYHINFVGWVYFLYVLKEKKYAREVNIFKVIYLIYGRCGWNSNPGYSFPKYMLFSLYNHTNLLNIFLKSSRDL